MIGPLRRRSLFWTFAGAFLLVLLVATLLQALVVVAVVEPIAERLTVARAELAAREAARDIGRALAVAGEEAGAPGGDASAGGTSAGAGPLVEAAVQAALRDHGGEPRAFVLVYRAGDGRLIIDRGLPRHLRRLLATRVDGAAHGAARGAAGGAGWRRRPPPPDGAPERVGQPDDAATAAPPPPGWRAGQDPGRVERAPALREISRQPVLLAGGTVGEVLAFGLPRRFLLPPGTTPALLLLFLPLAAVVAAVAGLVMVRVLLGRLRGLEELAARVTAGDLEARVARPGRDEIGRLGRRFNRMTASLAEARDRLESGDRQRRRLLADISHELATPLTSIRGYTETLLDPEVPKSTEEEARYLDDILAEARRMDLILADLLELTRLEARAVPFELERLDLAALCRHTIERFATRFRSASLELAWRGPEATVWIEADGRRLEQVIDNLLANALRYVPAGGHVEVTLGVVPEPHGERVWLAVRDDGPGFPVDDLPHVFDRFYRGDASRASAGSGLGLAIVKEIVLRHGGSIEARNRSAGGAELRIELPPSAAAHDPDPEGADGETRAPAEPGDPA
jgi:two-component system sensor histidine kinase BaeS